MRNVIEWTLAIRKRVRPSLSLSLLSFALAAGSGVILLWTQLELRNCHAWLVLYSAVLCHAPRRSHRPRFINTFTAPCDPAQFWVNYAKKPIKPASLHKGLALTLSCPLPATGTLTKSEVMHDLKQYSILQLNSCSLLIFNLFKFINIMPILFTSKLAVLFLSGYSPFGLFRYLTNIFLSCLCSFHTPLFTHVCISSLLRSSVVVDIF